MMERIDGKGKVFTNKLRTNQVEVSVTTVEGHVQGYIHVLPGWRVKDQLNLKDEQFVALTDATIETLGGDRRIDFIAINKQHIIRVVPIDEPEPTEENIYYP